MFIIISIRKGRIFAMRNEENSLAVFNTFDDAKSFCEEEILVNYDGLIIFDVETLKATRL